MKAQDEVSEHCMFAIVSEWQMHYLGRLVIRSWNIISNALVQNIAADYCFSSDSIVSADKCSASTVAQD